MVAFKMKVIILILFITTLLAGGYIFRENVSNFFSVLFSDANTLTDQGNKIKSARETDPKDKLTIPFELNEDYDPRINPPIFRILSTSHENDILSLQYVWPAVVAGKKVLTQIACPASEIEIFKAVDKSSTRVLRQQLYEYIEQTNPELMVFSGICETRTCEKISAKCRLNIQTIIK